MLLHLQKVAAGRVLEPLRNERVRVGQRGVQHGFVLFEVRNELFADCDHRLEQRLADLVADERIGGVDDVAIADAVRILESDSAMGQSVGGDHALIVSMVLVGSRSERRAR